MVALGAEAPARTEPAMPSNRSCSLDCSTEVPQAREPDPRRHSHRVEVADTGDPLKGWVVATRIDRVVSGDFAGKEFSFAIHSPAASGLEVGQQIQLHAEWTGKAYVVDPLQWRTAQ